MFNISKIKKVSSFKFFSLPFQNKGVLYNNMGHFRFDEIAILSHYLALYCKNHLKMACFFGTEHKLKFKYVRSDLMKNYKQTRMAH